jgi:hypothetical protein
MSQKLLDDLFVSIRAINDYYHKLKAIESLAKALIQCDKIDEPILIAKSLDNGYFKSIVLSTFAHSPYGFGKINESTILFNESLESSKKIDEHYYKSHSLYHI